MRMRQCICGGNVRMRSTPEGIDLLCKQCGRQEVIAPSGGKEDEQTKAIQNIDRLIEKNHTAWCEDDNDSDYSFNSSYLREIERLEALKIFVKAGVNYELDKSGGTLIVDGRLVYALRSRKWRNVGKNVWYKSRSPSDFIRLYVKKETK
jgi:hypothetical protein